MPTIAEITKVAGNAINEALEQYLIHLTTGENKVQEVLFLKDLILMMQPWLFFTETAMEKLQAEIYRDSLRINLIYSLTALFRQRFTLPEEDYQAYIKHLANSFNTQECSDPVLSMMATEYANRLTNPDAIEMMLENNRPLVMMVTTMLYIDTSILLRAIEVKR